MYNLKTGYPSQLLRIQHSKILIVIADFKRVNVINCIQTINASWYGSIGINASTHSETINMSLHSTRSKILLYTFFSLYRMLLYTFCICFRVRSYYKYNFCIRD